MSRPSTFVLGLAALALLAGCTAPGGAATGGVATTTSTTTATGPATSSSTSDAPATSTTSTPTPVTSATAQSATPAPATAASPSALPVVASRGLDGAPGVAVQINSVVVRDTITTVMFSVTNAGETRYDLGDIFQDHTTLKDATGKGLPGDTPWRADGVYVIDTKNAQRYLPARSADGTCACSYTLGLSVHKGGTQNLSTIVKALPADVTTVSVFVPGAGVFDNIPVTR